MYKVLYLTFHPNLGGGETILLSLISKLNRKMFDPVVVVTKEGQLSRELKRLKITTYILPLPGYLIRTLFIPGMSPSGIYRFYKLCKKIKPDLIHLNHLNLANYTGVSAKILKIPTVATSHGPWDSLYFQNDIIIQLFIDRILATTSEISKTLSRRNIINHKKITTVSLGIDPNVFKPGNKRLARLKLGLDQKDFIVTTVGRVDPIKDHITLLQAAKILASKIKNVKFFIVGSKLGDFSGEKNLYLVQIKDFLNKNPQLAKKVILGGFIDDIVSVYRSTDVYVSSSISEEFGLSLVEASMSSLPIVTTNVGNQSKIIKQNKTGFLVEPQAPAELARKILYLALNPKIRKQFGINARKHAMKKFTLEKYVQNVETEYKKLIFKH